MLYFRKERINKLNEFFLCCELCEYDICSYNGISKCIVFVGTNNVKTLIINNLNFKGLR